jgi:hypothetical protein
MEDIYLSFYITLNKSYYTVVEYCTFKNDEWTLPTFNEILKLSTIATIRRLNIRFITTCSYLCHI